MVTKSSDLMKIVEMMHDPSVMQKAAEMLDLGDVSELTNALREMEAVPKPRPPYLHPLTGRIIWPSIPSRTHENRCSLCGEKMFRCLRVQKQMLFRCPNHHHAWVKR